MELLKARIKEDMKASMRAKNKDRLLVVRTILAAIKQIEVDERIELDDERTIGVLDKMLKQRRESIRQFNEGGRVDLAEVEEAEILVIQEFLPQALTASEIELLIKEAIATTAATSMKDMGKVMGQLKPKMQGRADMSLVSKEIKAALIN
ncbi:MAG: GatB/YqeY domain-containing protein [Methylococcales bacterium]|nr:GatB/YqeY domain-containing protein [Methylococcales bacterium]